VKNETHNADLIYYPHHKSR